MVGPYPAQFSGGWAHRRHETLAFAIDRRTRLVIQLDGHEQAHSPAPFEEDEPQHVQPGLRGLVLDLIARAQELKSSDTPPIAGEDGHGDGADGLLRRSATRTGDAGDADANGRPRARP